MVILERKLDEEIFAEGLVVLGETVYLSTWKNGLLLKFDKSDFSLISSISYPRQGWGLTSDDIHPIASDGSATLYFLDPETLEPIRMISVHDDRGPVVNLNELEFINDQIYANVWKTDKIAIIDPNSGSVTSWLDLDGLSDQLIQDRIPGDLNGIMYDQGGDRLFVKGKHWSSLFEIRLDPVSD